MKLLKGLILLSLRSFKVTLGMIVILGVFYPLVVGALFFTLSPQKAQNPDLALVGQSFSTSPFFWGRAEGKLYSAVDPSFKESVRLAAKKYELKEEEIASFPIELLTPSGSGLDAFISVQGAYVQALRVAKARHLSKEKVIALIDRHTLSPTWGILGTFRVNIVTLNEELSTLK